MNFNRPHIYLRTIKKTGKSYIGKHNGNKGNKYKGSGVDWIKDYKLHVDDPKKDIIEVILEYVDDILLLNVREEYWLKKYNVDINENFYNKTNRSRGWSIVSDTQKEKLRLSHIGKKQSIMSSKKKSEKMKGKSKHNDESKNKIGLKNKKPKPIGFSEKLKKPKTQSHKNNLSISKSKRPINQFLNGELVNEWRSASYASSVLGYSQSSINNCVLNGGIYKGFEWKIKNIL